MSHTSNYLAFDLGAESGRAVLGRFDGERVQMETLHRFPNGPVDVGGSIYWDAPAIMVRDQAGVARLSQPHRIAS